MHNKNNYGTYGWKHRDRSLDNCPPKPKVEPFQGKSALCFYGQFRTGDYCYPSIKKTILDINHPDIFIVSEGDGEHIKEVYHPVSMETYSHAEIVRKVGSKKTKYKIHDWRAVPEKDVLVSWQNMRCEKLLDKYEKEHGKYDLVILGRFDTKILYVQTITKPDDNTLYVPYVNACLMIPDSEGHHFDGVSAHLCWGTSDTIHKLMNMYLYLDDYYKEADAWLAEKLLLWLCEKQKITIKFVDVSLMLIRGTSENPLAFYNQPLSEFPEFNQ
jgi:hypothetical protein